MPTSALSSATTWWARVNLTVVCHSSTRAAPYAGQAETVLNFERVELASAAALPRRRGATWWARDLVETTPYTSVLNYEEVAARLAPNEPLH